MSENQDKENAVTDSQETYYDNSQNISNTQMFNESQDFALIIGEDSDESTKNQSETIKNIGNSQTDENPVEKDVIEAEIPVVPNEGSTPYEIEKETQSVLTKVDETKKDKPVKGSNMEDNVDNPASKEKRGNDEDEIIQGTPPEVSSPSRMLLSGKRRANSIDEPASKIQRTSSQSDALKLDKENSIMRSGKARLDYKLILSNLPDQEKKIELDILCDNTEQFDKNKELHICATQSHPQNIVIEETQDSEASEPILLSNVSNNQKESKKHESQKFGEKDKASNQYNSELDTTNNKPKVNEEEKLQPIKKLESDIFDNTLEAATNEQDDKKNTQDNKANTVMDIVEKNLTEEKVCNDEKHTEQKKDTVRTGDKEFSNAMPLSNDSASDSTCDARSNSPNKSRKSVELIFHRTSTSQERNKYLELVKIDEEGEEIVLDSSNEEGEKIVLDSSNEEVHLRLSASSETNSPQNTTIYKSCFDSKSNSESSYKSTPWIDICKHSNVIATSDCRLTDRDDERTISDTTATTKTISSGSDQLIDDVISDAMKVGVSKSAANDLDVDERFNLSSKLSDTMDLVNVVSDSDGDSLLISDNLQNKFENKDNISVHTATTKTTAYEKKIRLLVELKYLIHVDDNTKEIVYKEVTDVHCDPLVEPSGARRNSDTSGSLADISGNANKDNSPGSVISNPQPFQLPMSRFSIASTISSSSSVSSAASLDAKFFKDVHFSQPKGRAKHARRPAIESVSEKKVNLSDTLEKIMHGWKNAHFITDTVLQSANMGINLPEIFQHDNENKSEDKVMPSTPELGSAEEKVLSSTPEPVQDERVTSQLATPKSTRIRKSLKRSRKTSNSTARNNGTRKASPEVISTSQEDRHPIAKRKRDDIDTIKSEKPIEQTTSLSTPSRLRPENLRTEALKTLTPQSLVDDDLVGKVVFARWSDNNYYPGEVTEKTKGKFRVQFYDGKSKLLIEEFIIPMPRLLREGLSVYAMTKEDGYGSMGIIEQSENVNNMIYYTVEMDNGNRVKVQIENIFLMPGQAQILKEEVDMESKHLPKTPQHLGEVSLYNLLDRKRRQPSTPTSITPQSRKAISPRASRTSDCTPASGSGVHKIKGKLREISSSETETKTSDSNVSSIEDVDGVQPELVTVPVAQNSKGPSSRMKGKGRTRAKQTRDDAELGPIPPASSTIFKNMCFILTSTSSDIIFCHHVDDSYSETGTENEEEWMRTPFIKDRVKRQLVNGGGTVYDSFKLIPLNEYKNTKLITNVPNLTAKSIQCLSVGISVYSHNWVIQCCKENTTLKPSPYELPAGWSLEKKIYIESYNRSNKQPFTGMIVGMPMMDNKNCANRSIQFWSRICENAGAGVQIINDSETDFSHVTAILTDNRCPTWLIEKADSWQIPLISTVWITQCIISGQSLSPDSHPHYKHTFIQS